MLTIGKLAAQTDPSTNALCSGVLLVLAGLYMLNAYFFVVPELAG
jgi:hypothetical protein